MAKRKAVRFLVQFVFLGATAGTLAGYSAYAIRPGRALQPDATTGSVNEPSSPQVSNTMAKADRLAAPIKAALNSSDNVTYSLASATPSVDAGRFSGRITAYAPMLPNPVIGIEPVAPAPSAVAAEPPPKAATAPLPLPRPKKLLPPPAPNGVLDDAQIASVKDRLRLTEDQAQYWPAVETALRDVVKTQLHSVHLRPTRNGKANIDVNSPEVQRLIWAAMPLLMRLREDQKREVRKLARVMGLDAVASQI